MRKTGLLVLSLLLTVISGAQNTVIGYVDLMSNSIPVAVKVDDEGAPGVSIGVGSMNISDLDEIPYIYLRGKESIRKFREALVTMEEKWRDWDQIVKDNNIVECEKEFPVRFPDVQVFWKRGRWYNSERYGCSVMAYYYVNNREKRVGIGGVADDVLDSDMYLSWTFRFKNPDGLHKLITVMSPDNLRKALGMTELK